ncbi:MAG: hypothetical protein BroJett042_30200 [Bacteroidota bacterium]|nr:MAG: hypothetical protein BroJett042_30200 [Bacteroidota bacterium]
MNDWLISFVKAKGLIDSSVAIKLLRSRSLSLIISFLYREFKTTEQPTIPYQQLIQKLGDFLEEIEYSEDDDELATEKLILDYDEKAKLYIDRWNEAHYLRVVIDDTTKEPHVLLSQHTEKVFQIFEVFKEKEYVSVESKFKDIFSKLRDIIGNANPDKQKKIDELEKQKNQIEEEIRKIKVDGYVGTYEDYQIKARFEEVNRMANELIGDFREVEDNFKDITRKIYERQQNNDSTKGQLLAETFDALNELKKTNQGKSFYSFWQFLLDDASQIEFQKLTKELYEVLEDRQIEISSKSLRRLKSILHLAARKVLDKNTVLADKLSREIVAKDQLENRKMKELMSRIRQLAIQRMDKTSERQVYLEIDDTPNIYLPLERKLGDKTELSVFSTKAETAKVSLNEIDELSKIYKTDIIDKRLLLENIKELLSDRNQISLEEVIKIKGLTKGLAELLAYITLVNTSPKFFINDNTTETIQFNKVEGKFIELPQVIYSK